MTESTCIGMGLGSVEGGAIHDALGSYSWAPSAIAVPAVVLGVTLRAPAPRWCPGLAPAPGSWWAVSR